MLRSAKPARFNTAAQLYMDGPESRSHVIQAFGKENQPVERFNPIKTPCRIKSNVS
jgi:hypothetical protein